MRAVAPCSPCRLQKQEVSADVLAVVQQLSEAGALKKWGAVETPARRNVLQGKSPVSPPITPLPACSGARCACACELCPAACLSIGLPSQPPHDPCGDLFHYHTAGELRLVGISNPEKIGSISVRNDAAFLFSVVGTTSVAAVVSVGAERAWRRACVACREWQSGVPSGARQCPGGAAVWGPLPPLSPSAPFHLSPTQVLGQLPGDWGFFSSYLTGEPWCLPPLLQLLRAVHASEAAADPFPVRALRARAGGIALAVLAVGSVNPGLLQFAIDQFRHVGHAGRLISAVPCAGCLPRGP